MQVDCFVMISEVKAKSPFSNYTAIGQSTRYASM